MKIAVDISLYPLDADYVPPIKDFIERLNRDRALQVNTNAMSTQIAGRARSRVRGTWPRNRREFCDGRPLGVRAQGAGW